MHQNDEVQEECTRAAWRAGASRREQCFVALGMSEPVWYGGRWHEWYNPWNPLTLIVTALTLGANLLTAHLQTFWAVIRGTLQVLFVTDRSIPTEEIVRFREAPDCRVAEARSGEHP